LAFCRALISATLLLDGRLFLSRKGLDPGALRMLQSLPFRTARIARFNKGDALGLSGRL